MINYTLLEYKVKNRLNILILLILVVFFNTAVAQVVVVLPDSIIRDIDSTTSQILNERVPQSKADSLIQYAYSFIGNRYQRGGITNKGFDCSGYTMTVFKHFGIKLPHTSAGQGLVGVEIPKANIKKGDLILFKGRNRRSRRIGHVGIVISEKGQPVRFIHSSTSAGVRIDRLEFQYYRSRYLKSVRLPDLYK